MNLERIDTSTTAGKAEVMRLAAEGRRVAFNYRSAFPRRTQHGWNEVTGEPSWNWLMGDFAIIAEPVGPEEVWLVVNGNNVLSGWNTEDGCKSAVETPAQAAVRYIRADLAGEKG